MIRAAFTLLLLAAPCTAWASGSPVLPSRNWPAPADRNDALLQDVVLGAHNLARAGFGVAPVAWSEELAVEARAYAGEMARTGIYKHDMSPARRAKSGENMWRGSRGIFSYEIMVGGMIDEAQHFRPGAFPENSRTGDWHAVGHYTQIVWPTTTNVGCGLASSATTDYFVCRYSPKGNRDGVFLSPRLRVADRGDPLAPAE